jgi:hypothetical protein
MVNCWRLLVRMFQGMPSFSCHLLPHDAILHAASDPCSVNSTMDFSKICNLLALEAQVISLQGSPALSGSIPPHQPSPGAAITPGHSQLHESLLISDQSEPEAAPGARGQSNRDGLYAGPTSTVSHLVLVCLLCVTASAILQNDTDQVISAYFMDISIQFTGCQRWQ